MMAGVIHSEIISVDAAGVERMRPSQGKKAPGESVDPVIEPQFPFV
jgi:hypothetical protein